MQFHHHHWSRMSNRPHHHYHHHSALRGPPITLHLSPRHLFSYKNTKLALRADYTCLSRLRKVAHFQNENIDSTTRPDVDSDLVLTWRLLRGVQKRMEWARWTVGEEDEDDEDEEDEDSYSGEEGEWVDVDDATLTPGEEGLAYDEEQNEDNGVRYGHRVGFRGKNANAEQMTEEQKEELLNLARAVHREYERVVGFMRAWGEWVEKDDREQRTEWMYRGMG